MELTQTQKLLIYGLRQFPLSEENQEGIFLLLKNEDDQLLMIYYLQTHPNATEEEIMEEYVRILKQRKMLQS